MRKGSDFLEDSKNNQNLDKIPEEDKIEIEIEYPEEFEFGSELVQEIYPELEDIDIIEKEDPEEIKIEDANTTNCLALTIQEDHRIVAIKNVLLRSVRMSWKVVVSTITLALIKLFS